VRQAGALSRPPVGPILVRAAPLLALASGALALRLMGQPAAAAVLGLGGLSLCAAKRLGRAARLGLMAALAVLALALWTHPDAMWLLVRSLPALGMLLMALHFGATLLPGEEPLITRYTRYDPGVRIAECAGYTRGLTWVWTLVFVALTPVYALALLRLPPLDGPADNAEVFASGAILMLALFLGEHVVRTLRFPHFGTATPPRTLRAVLAATMAEHA
jgi:uncharacterized membrane protein